MELIGKEKCDKNYNMAHRHNSLTSQCDRVIGMYRKDTELQIYLDIYIIDLRNDRLKTPLFKWSTDKDVMQETRLLTWANSHAQILL